MHKTYQVALANSLHLYELQAITVAVAAAAAATVSNVLNSPKISMLSLHACMLSRSVVSDSLGPHGL